MKISCIYKGFWESYILIFTWFLLTGMNPTTLSTVTGGAAGENDSVFVVQNACTLIWSNKKSWVRPISIKYDIEVLAIKD